MKHGNSIDAQHVGQDFDAFLQEDGIALEVQARAAKKVLAALVAQLGSSGRTVADYPAITRAISSTLFE